MGVRAFALWLQHTRTPGGEKGERCKFMKKSPAFAEKGQGRAYVRRRTSKKEEGRETKQKERAGPWRRPALLAPLARLERTTFRLGATSFGSCLVVRHASKCPQTRMNTGFFIELPVAEYLKISPNIGSFCTQIEPAIRQILDRFSAVTPNTGDSLELSYPII